MMGEHHAPPPLDLVAFEANAQEVAASSCPRQRRRLTILCKLVKYGEAAGTLVEATRLSQSALFRHLAKTRNRGILTFRRERQTLWYRIADPRIEQLMAELYRLYCRREQCASVHRE